MDPHGVGDDELDAREPDAVVRERGEPERLLRVADVQHDGRARAGAAPTGRRSAASKGSAPR